MIDFGIISTGIATVIGGIVTGLGTWYTMANKASADLDNEQKVWRAELVAESKSLRERINQMQLAIDQLMAERAELKEKVTLLTIQHIRNEAKIEELTRKQDDTTGNR